MSIDTIPDGDVLPLKAGCWVARGDATSVEVARVKKCYRVGSEIVADLSIYARDGARLGRTTPAMGGPRSYEPACPISDWFRIERPDFPLTMAWEPGSDGSDRYIASYTASLKRIPFGAFPPAGARTIATSSLRRSDYDPLLDATSRRLAAETLRDVAGEIPAAASNLRERARTLEDTADRIHPRTLSTRRAR